MDAEKEPGIRFSGVAVDRIRFNDVDVGDSPPKELAFQFAITRRSWESPQAVDVTVSVRVASEKGDSAFSLELSVTGRFEPSDHENIDLEDFSRHNGPALVMPFVRELVANITARSRNGMVLLPPVNVVALVERDGVGSPG